MQIGGFGKGRIKTKLKIALVINIGLLVAEVFGYFISNSLALLGDAGHVLTDILAIGASITAINLAMLPPHEEATFGHHRAEVLAALFNAVILLFVSGYIFYESYNRFVSPVTIKSTEMLIIAVIGLIGNLYATYILHGHKDINVRGAYLHLLADTLSSGAVVVGAVIIYYTGYFTIDPILSVIIGIMIVSGSIKLLKESIGIIMQWTPEDLELPEVIDAIKQLDEVRDVHDVHLWTLCSSIHSFSAHILVDNISMRESGKIKSRIREILHEEFHVYHSTLELECIECGDDTVQMICHPEEEEADHGHSH
ncbi:MAG: cation diffusion facilitator family transporter [Thermoplasmatota archaeon]